MLKFGNIILSSVLLSMLTGCSGEKAVQENAIIEKAQSDAELIVAAYDAAIGGDESATVVVKKSELREELTKKGVPDSYTYRITSKNLLMSEKYKNCKAVFDKSYGDWATISQDCGNMEIDGITYMKKDNGAWKVPVRE